jgi:TP901 family phage tail tape measure protein
MAGIELDVGVKINPVIGEVDTNAFLRDLPKQIERALANAPAIKQVVNPKLKVEGVDVSALIAQTEARMKAVSEAGGKGSKAVLDDLQKAKAALEQVLALSSQAKGISAEAITAARALSQGKADASSFGQKIQAEIAALSRYLSGFASAVAGIRATLDKNLSTEKTILPHLPGAVAALGGGGGARPILPPAGGPGDFDPAEFRNRLISTFRNAVGSLPGVAGGIAPDLKIPVGFDLTAAVKGLKKEGAEVLSEANIKGLDEKTFKTAKANLDHFTDALVHLGRVQHGMLPISRELMGILQGGTLRDIPRGKQEAVKEEARTVLSYLETLNRFSDQVTKQFTNINKVSEEAVQKQKAAVAGLKKELADTEAQARATAKGSEARLKADSDVADAKARLLKRQAEVIPRIGALLEPQTLAPLSRLPDAVKSIKRALTDALTPSESEIRAGQAKANEAFLAQQKQANEKRLAERKKADDLLIKQEQETQARLAAIAAREQTLRSREAAGTPRPGFVGDTARGTQARVAATAGEREAATQAHLRALGSETLQRFADTQHIPQRLAGAAAASIRGTIEALKEQRDAVRDNAPAFAHYTEEIGRHTATLGELERKARGHASLADQLSRVGRTFVQYGLGYSALFGAISKIRETVTAVIDLEDSLKQIQAITRSTGAEMVTLGTSVEELAKRTRFGLGDITSAVQVLAQAGQDVSQIPETASAVAALATASGTTLKVAADIVSTAMAIWDKERPSSIANQIASAANESKIAVEDMAQVFAHGGAAADAFGLKLKDFLAATAVLRNAGLAPSTIGTSLTSLFRDVTALTDKQVEAFQQAYARIGEVVSGDEIRKKFASFRSTDNPLLTILREFKRIGADTAGTLEILYGKLDSRTNKALIPLLQNIGELAELSKGIGAGDRAFEASAVAMTSLRASLQNLNDTFQILLASLSSDVVPGLSGIVRTVSGLVEKLIDVNNSARESTGSGIFGTALGAGAAGFSYGFTSPGNLLSRTIKGVVAALGAGAVGVGVKGVTADLTGSSAFSDVSGILSAVGVIAALKKATAGLSGLGKLAPAFASIGGSADPIIKGMSAAGQAAAAMTGAAVEAGVAVAGVAAAASPFTKALARVATAVRTFGTFLLTRGLGTWSLIASGIFLALAAYQELTQTQQEKELKKLEAIREAAKQKQAEQQQKEVQFETFKGVGEGVNAPRGALAETIAEARGKIDQLKTILEDQFKQVVPDVEPLLAQVKTFNASQGRQSDREVLRQGVAQAYGVSLDAVTDSLLDQVIELGTSVSAIASAEGKNLLKTQRDTLAQQITQGFGAGDELAKAQFDALNNLKNDPRFAALRKEGEAKAEETINLLEEYGKSVNQAAGVGTQSIAQQAEQIKKFVDAFVGASSPEVREQAKIALEDAVRDAGEAGVGLLRKAIREAGFEAEKKGEDLTKQLQAELSGEKFETKSDKVAPRLKELEVVLTEMHTEIVDSAEKVAEEARGKIKDVLKVALTKEFGEFVKEQKIPQGPVARSLGVLAQAAQPGSQITDPSGQVKGEILDAVAMVQKVAGQFETLVGPRGELSREAVALQEKIGKFEGRLKEELEKQGLGDLFSLDKEKAAATLSALEKEAEVAVKARDNYFELEKAKAAAFITPEGTREIEAEQAYWKSIEEGAKESEGVLRKFYAFRETSSRHLSEMEVKHEIASLKATQNRYEGMRDAIKAAINDVEAALKRAEDKVKSLQEERGSALVRQRDQFDEARKGFIGEQRDTGQLSEKEAARQLEDIKRERIKEESRLSEVLSSEGQFEKAAEAARRAGDAAGELVNFEEKFTALSETAAQENQALADAQEQSKTTVAEMTQAVQEGKMAYAEMGQAVGEVGMKLLAMQEVAKALVLDFDTSVAHSKLDGVQARLDALNAGIDSAAARAASVSVPGGGGSSQGTFEELGLSKGGFLPGYGGGDRHPVVLESGEAVIRKEAVVQYRSALQDMNALRAPKLAGGMVPSPSFKGTSQPSPSAPGSSVHVTIDIGGKEAKLFGERDQVNTLVRALKEVGRGR